MRRASLLTSFALFASVAVAGAAEPDKALLDAARAAQPAVLDSLRDMVLIESGSSDKDGLGRMADYVEGRLKALGMQTERLPVSTGPGMMVKGTLTGAGKKRFMLIAHMDTVYQKGILGTQPLKTEGNKLYGPGVADDKGGIATILHALAILRDRNWRDYAQLTVLFNPDEEVGSIGSGETIANLAAQQDVVLSYEPTPAKDVAKVEGVLMAAAGTATARLEVEGVTAHAGAAPERGRNALIELAHQLLQTQDIAKDIPGAQLNWTLAGAGTVRNQIPERAWATADVRLTRPHAAAKLLSALQTKVGESQRVPGTKVGVTLDVERPPFVADERGAALGRQAQAIYAELDGRQLMLIPGTGGATDAGFAAKSGKAVVLESFGLAGFGYHARDEYIEVDSIVPRLYLSTRLLTELGKQ